MAIFEVEDRIHMNKKQSVVSETNPEDKQRFLKNPTSSKVKLIEDFDIIRLEGAINDFLEGKYLVNLEIKYCGDTALSTVLAIILYREMGQQ